MKNQEGVILLVEDNPGDVALTLRALNLHGIKNEVVVARDGAEALDWLFGTGTHEGRDVRVGPVLILMDLNMPKMNGVEVLQRIRADECTRMIPVVMLTTSSEERDVVASYRSGVNSYVRKPVDFGEFAGAMHQVCDYWLGRNVSPPVAKRDK